MDLPFSNSEFLDVFGSYNTAMWPAAVAIWLASLMLSIALIGNSQPPHRSLSALLVVHWAWSGLSYHAAFFSTVNPAAWLFAGMFLAQAALIGWTGIFQRRLQFSRGRSLRHVLAIVFVAYSLLYPMINLTQGLTFPRMPTFGVPCPTTIFTIGLLLTVEALPWSIALIPVLWSAIGGSAALLLGVRADVMLPIAGLVLIWSAVEWKRCVNGFTRPA